MPAGKIYTTAAWVVSSIAATRRGIQGEVKEGRVSRYGDTSVFGTGAFSDKEKKKVKKGYLSR
jgi:hypothetical protein